MSAFTFDKPQTIDEIEAALAEVSDNVAHGEAEYNPWALRALSLAEGLLVDYVAALREIQELKAARS